MVVPGFLPHATLQLKPSWMPPAPRGACGDRWPMKMSSAVSHDTSAPLNSESGTGSGTIGISALFPMQLCRCRIHLLNASNSGLSYEAITR